jgi:transketolase
MAQSVVSNDSLRVAFGDALFDLAPLSDFQIFDADLSAGCGLSRFRETYPDRLTNIGIAEQTLIGIAAGYSRATGQKAIASTFAMFGWRAAEIFSLSVAYNRFDVTLALSHAGLGTGPDGASCQPMNVISTWASIPNTVVLWPSTPALMRQAVTWLLGEYEGPAVLITGRSPVTFDLPEAHRFHFGKVQPAWGTDIPEVVICGVGPGVGVAVEAAQILSSRDIPTVALDCHTLAPFDEAGVRGFCSPAKVVVTVEDGGPSGLYSLVCRALSQAERRPPVTPVCVWGWGESGEAPELYQKYGITVDGVIRVVERWL